MPLLEIGTSTPGSAIPPLNLQEATVHWLSLRFKEPDLEKEFQRAYYKTSLRQIRIGMVLAILLFASFGLLDPYIMPETKQFAWALRYSVFCPLTFCVFLCSFTRWFERIWEISIVSLSMLASAIMIAIIFHVPPYNNQAYYVGLLLVYAYIFTFVRLRFITAAATCLAITLLYEVLAVGSGALPGVVLLNNAYFLASMTVIGGSAGYFMERSIRADFVQKRIIQAQTAQLHSALLTLEDERQQAVERSIRDPLTNLYNRRHFYAISEKELKKNARHISIILLDIDHFKTINDTHGHLIGDQVLQEVADRISCSVRQGDFLCRYGGEEFALLLPDTDHPTAIQVSQRLREQIAAWTIEIPTGSVTVTISLGVATLVDSQSKKIDQLLDLADKALYEAKDAGRNQIKTWCSGSG